MTSELEFSNWWCSSLDLLYRSIIDFMLLEVAQNCVSVLSRMGGFVLKMEDMLSCISSGRKSIEENMCVQKFMFYHSHMNPSFEYSVPGDLVP